MTLDGVIQKEENDGHGFKSGGRFFPFADDVTGARARDIPVTLGRGKRLFQDGAIPASFKVTNSTVAPKGIICAPYERDGDVRSGSAQIEENK